MNLTKELQTLWTTIIEQGVDDKQSAEGKKIALLNQAALLTSLSCFVMAVYCALQFADKIYVAITLSLTFSYLVIIFLHRLKKPIWVHYYLTFFNTSWIYVVVVFTGGFFSQGAASISAILLSFFFFYNQKKMIVAGVLFHVILYVSAVTYASFYPPLLKVLDIPFDESMAFLLSICWIYVIINVREIERQQMVNDLIKKNMELEERTEDLRRFTHIASHDLKSPLRTIISFLGLMERDISKGSIDRLAGNLEFVKSGAQQLNYLIEDVLELSKLNDRKLKPKKVVNLDKTLQQVQSNLHSEITEKNCRITVTTLPTIECAEVEFTLLFQNLIQNGIKYNESGSPEISIWSEIKGNKLMIYCQDNGIGIEKEFHDRIFEMFKRLHNNDRYKGTGLGLSLCKKIVNSYGGQISIDSAIGQGSTFAISLPTSMIVDKAELEIA